jgi:predicted RNase H-like HicB family nuclease
MKRFTAIVHQGLPEVGGYWATCVEIPGANGQGETKAEYLESLSEAVRELLELNRAEALADDPNAEETEVVLA